MLQVANSRIYIHISTRKTLYSYVRQWRGASESGLIMAEAASDWFRSHTLLDHYNRNAALWDPIDFGSHTLFIHFPRHTNFFFSILFIDSPRLRAVIWSKKTQKKKSKEEKEKKKLYNIVRRAGSGNCLFNKPLQYGDIRPRAASTFGIEWS